MASKYMELRKKMKTKNKKEADTPTNEKAQAMEVNELMSLLEDATGVVKEEVVETVSKEEPTRIESKNTSTSQFPTAINIFYSDKQRKFIQVKIEYDLDSGYSKIVAADPIADSGAVALYKINNYFTMKLLRGEKYEHGKK